MKFYIFLLYLLSSVLASASLLAPWVSTNVRLGEDPAALPPGTGKNQAEPHAIRSAVDPDLILATFQEGRFSDGGARNNGYAISEDGGFTWKRSLNPQLTVINGGPYHRATDPVGGIDRDGTLYLNSLVSLDPNFDLGRLVVQRSEDRGKSWSEPYIVYTGFNNGLNDRIFPDKNWMVVNDYPESPTSGRVVVTWTNFRTLTEGADVNDYLIMSSYSDDRGSRWSPPAYVTHPGNEFASSLQYQGSQPVFLPGGGLAIVFHDFLLNQLEISYSPDGGETYPFSPERIHNGYILYDAPNMRDGMFLPSVNVAKETGDLYVAHTARDSTSDNFGHVYFLRSRRTDGGGSPAGNIDWKFSQPVKVSGQSPLRVVASPTIAVSPDGLVVSIYFYDNRNGPAVNSAGDFYAVQSVDGGVSWTEPFRLTETTFDLSGSTSTSRGYMIGDYFGFAAPQATGQAGVAVWVDTRSGNADPWSARIGGLEESVFNSWLQVNLPHSISKDGQDALRYADLDRDEIPNIMEYILGGNPISPDTSPAIVDGAEFLVLNSSTDPETRVVVTAGTGRWPVSSNSLSMGPAISSHGEGYWDNQQWATGGAADHLRFSINNGENWFLLGDDSFLRWVREYPDSWVWSPWFGWAYTPSAPWLFHLSLGWVYDFDGILFSSGLSTYLYPDLAVYPWIYSQDGRYLYIMEDSPWVYDSESKAWISAY